MFKIFTKDDIEFIKSIKTDIDKKVEKQKSFLLSEKDKKDSNEEMALASPVDFPRNPLIEKPIEHNFNKNEKAKYQK